MHGKTLENGTLVPKTLNLFCKSAPENAERRKAFDTHKFFKREVILYTKVLPAFLTFQKERGLTGDDLFQAYPKCYTTVIDDENEQYLLIMEDLRAKGYEMRPKELPMNLTDCRLLVAGLGRLHGISVAMKDQKPEIFEEFRQLNDISRPLLEKTMAATFEFSYDSALKVVKDPTHKKIVEKTRTNYAEWLRDCLAEDAAPRLGVLTHGDCWNNNLMFRYEKPKDVSVFSSCIRERVKENSILSVYQYKIY